MIAFFGNIKKEVLLLLRDKAGLSFLFIMPIVLVVLMTLLQDKTIKKLQVEQLDIAVVNLDNGIVGKSILKGLKKMKIFHIHQQYHGDSLTLALAQKAVAKGDFQVGILIPPKSSIYTRRIISNEVRKQLPTIGTQIIPDSLLPMVDIQLFFDPIIKGSLRKALHSSLEQLMANIRTIIVFKSYTTTLQKITGKSNIGKFPLDRFSLSESEDLGDKSLKIPSSTQHNVPAWTVFAIFFMVIPLATQIITEREEGSLMRLKISPTPYSIPLIARICIYSLLAVIQAITLLLIGKYLLPLMGMQAFDIHGNYISFLILTLFIGLAAAAFGIAVGNIAKTHHQASVFGSISVVLLAAIGGIWVPTYMMPDSLLKIAQWSPLNWSLQGYYDIVLKADTINQLGGVILKLGLFFVLNLGIAVIYGKRKNT